VNASLVKDGHGIFSRKLQRAPREAALPASERYGARQGTVSA